MFKALGITDDKTQHAIIGAGVFALAYAVTKSPEKALAMALGAGIAGEVYDYFSGKGVVDYKDILATTGGGITIYLVVKLLSNQ